MGRVVRSSLAVVWAIAGVLVVYFTGIWWDRASARGDAPDLSGWGLFFVIGLIVLLAGIGFGYWLARQNHNEASAFVLVTCAVLITLGLTLLAPAIGWAASLRLSALVFGALIYFVVHFWIAWRSR